MKRTKNFFQGCLVGGAIGDALGWPVEFMKLRDIRHKYGPDGMQDLVAGASGKAEITDDTQMTLFTAEGILRAQTRGHLKGICHEPTVVFHAYQRWLLTQGYPRVPDDEWVYDGWLLCEQALHARRAPGNTCLSALASGKMGSIGEPPNQSKGCGGVMRVAPAGLFYPREQAFQMGADFAALTHGHPSGYLSAGTLAHLIACLIEGQWLESAVRETMAILSRQEHHEECLLALKTAVSLVERDVSDIDAIRQLGEGWVGEEALAISVFCAMRHQDDFRRALTAAVNHDGDSDSTGAITGNILGAYLGMERIPAEWTSRVELLDVLTQVADDLLKEYTAENVDWDRYPGY